MRPLLVSVLLLLLPLPGSAAVHHDLHVHLDPAAGRLMVEDRITLPQAGAVEFLLHPGLEVEATAGAADLERLEPEQGLARYRVRSDGREVALRYAGRIRHQVRSAQEGIGRSRGSTPGFIGPEGIYLSGAVAWYPLVLGDELVTFRLTPRLPQGWLSVSQGARVRDVDGSVQWRIDQPQDEIYLIAGRYTLYRRDAGPVEAQVFLREPDAALAQRYLDATERYVALYSRLIGPYPYAKFALVENFWETGYGMPSFTLLGARVLRLPFIVDTSYPHEILHNWWGNGVYVDWGRGNWSEGLTAYLSDHLMQARRGRGAEYRRDQLQKYAEYVEEHAAVPLARFVSRHGEASQAIGYGKGAMVFHMLRGELGEERFLEGLRTFYRRYRFRHAAWDDLKQVFEAVGGADLDGFFEQWVERAGAPALALEAADVQPDGTGYRVRATLAQTQDGPPFVVRVPVVVQHEGGSGEAEWLLDARRGSFDMYLEERPLRLAVDPRFDLFRRLHAAELPASLDRLFGADAPLLVLPATAAAPLREAYRAFARAWGVAVVADSELDALPAERAVFVLGWENRFVSAVAAPLAGQAAQLDAAGVVLEGRRYPRAGHCAVVTAPHGTAARAFIGCDEAAPIAGLARKLPHYGKYSYLLFAGGAPQNRVKGQWAVQRSPLAVPLAEGPLPPLPLEPRAPLTHLIAGQ